MTSSHVRTLGLLLAAALLLAPGAARASKKLAAETGLKCTACHDKPGSRMLTDQGKYFEATRSMEGYAQLRENFDKCTLCHVRKPGSTRLTEKGQQFVGLVKDMKGLKVWLDQNHPKASGNK